MRDDASSHKRCDWGAPPTRCATDRWSGNNHTKCAPTARKTSSRSLRDRARERFAHGDAQTHGSYGQAAATNGLMPDGPDLGVAPARSRRSPHTFTGFADILGFLFLLIGVMWMVQAFDERPINDLWWLSLITGI